MAIWYKVNKDEKGIEDFMNCNSFFHDFRIERVSYIPGQDMVEIFLMYDTGKEGVLLRFMGIHGINVNVKGDYLADWITSATLLLRERNTFQWIPDHEVTPKETDTYMPLTWVESDEIIWAVTDGSGNPIPLPRERLDQVWHIYDKILEKHFRFQEWK